MKRVGVIGGGPAGMMAAYAAAANGNEVTLFERNEKLGKKLYITGKGRCNLSNTAQGEDFLQNVVSNPKFLNGAIRKFSPSDTFSFFEKFGVSLKVERGNRVFPVSDKASDITAALVRAMQQVGVRVRLNTNPERIAVKDREVTGVVVAGKEEPFDCVIVATGGISYPQTGSTGWGVEEGNRLGLDTIPWVSALCPIRTEKIGGILREKLDYPEGVSLKNVTLSLWENGRKKAEEFGELLFTREGVSGPIALTISSLANRLALENCVLRLDLKPALDAKKLDERLLRDFSAEKNRMLKNAMHGLLPSGLINMILEITKIPKEKPINTLSRADRGALVHVLKCVEFSGISLESVEKGIVSAGGIAIGELNPTTMTSRKIRGLKFAGETIDVDALTGGFNIQIALSTGFVAGDSVGKEKE